MLSFYILAAIVLILVAYAGIEETMRLVRFIDLWINYQIIKFRMARMRRKLERELGLPPRNWEDEDI